MTPAEIGAFWQGVGVGAGLGLFLGLVVIPLAVDAWVSVMRRRRGR